MKYNPNVHHRKSIRLKGYDYSHSDSYFITICTKNKENYFGTINNMQMRLSKIGNIANQCWQEIPKHFPIVQLNQYVIMPNHVHGIIIIGGEDNNCVDNNAKTRVVGVQDFEPLQGKINKFQHIISNSIGSIIRGFKIGVTKWCKNNNLDFEWQRNYYDHIIHNEKSYNRISKYITNNPYNWEDDKLFLK